MVLLLRFVGFDILDFLLRKFIVVFIDFICVGSSFLFFDLLFEFCKFMIFLV